jgi:hypothetical protein
MAGHRRKTFQYAHHLADGLDAALILVRDGPLGGFGRWHRENLLEKCRVTGVLKYKQYSAFRKINMGSAAASLPFCF